MYSVGTCFLPSPPCVCFSFSPLHLPFCTGTTAYCYIWSAQRAQAACCEGYTSVPSLRTVLPCACELVSLTPPSHVLYRNHVLFKWWTQELQSSRLTCLSLGRLSSRQLPRIALTGEAQRSKTFMQQEYSLSPPSLPPSPCSLLPGVCIFLSVCLCVCASVSQLPLNVCPDLQDYGMESITSSS